MANITRNQLNMHHLKDSLNVNHCRTSTRGSAMINIEAIFEGTVTCALF